MTATTERPPAGRPARTRRRRGPRAEVLVLSALALVSVVVLAGLAAGLRPMVVASGSMRPTLEVGDVVVARESTAGALRPGEVVTFLDPGRGGQSVTHRVRRVTEVDLPTGPGVRVQTRGDANSASERWTVPVSTPVGVTAAHLPMHGTWLLHLQSPTARWVGLSVGLGVLVAPLVLRGGGAPRHAPTRHAPTRRAARRGRRRERARAGDRAQVDQTTVQVAPVSRR